mmetsp:Transcript_11267/g.22183  ORF Transcript_11267/g.22183 Transcript_11267/m.22183 type:complete len:379 (+) Transcript_11267:261-1397(+)
MIHRSLLAKEKSLQWRQTELDELVEVLKAKEQDLNKVIKLLETKDNFHAKEEAVNLHINVFKQEKAEFVKELKAFGKERQQLQKAQTQMCGGQDTIAATLRLVEARLVEVAQLKQDYEKEYKLKIQELKLKESELEKRNPREGHLMFAEDVLSTALRLEEYECLLVEREAALEEVEDSMLEEKEDIEHTASMFESIHSELETAKLEVQNEWDRLEQLKTELAQAQDVLLQQTTEIAHKDSEIANREHRVKQAESSLKEKRHQLKLFEQSLVQRESSLDERSYSKESCESRYVDKLEREVRRQQEDLAYERVQLEKARAEVERMKATVHQKMKLMDTTESSNELRRINKMLQESYLTPRDVVTPGSTEDSPLTSLRSGH